MAVSMRVVQTGNTNTTATASGCLAGSVPLQFFLPVAVALHTLIIEFDTLADLFPKV